VRLARATLAAALAAGAASLVAVPSSAGWTGVRHPHSAPVAASSAHSTRVSNSPRRAASSTAKDPALAPGFCLVATGPALDAYPESAAVTGGPASMDSLDLLQLGVKQSGANITFQQTLTSLHSRPDGGPMIYGRGNYYLISFLLPDGTSAYTDLEYPGQPDQANPGQFIVWTTWGMKVPSGLPSPAPATLRTITGEGTGVVDSTTDTVTWSIPMSAFNIQAGTRIAGPTGQSDMVTAAPRWVQPDPNTPPTTGFMLIADQGQLNSADFVVGTGCVANS